MSTYARFWSAGAIVVAAVGLAAVVVLHGLPLTAVALAFTVSLGVCVRWGRFDRPVPEVPSALQTGAAIGTAVVGSMGFGLFLGAPGFLSVLVLAVLSPRALEALRAHPPTALMERRPARDTTAPTEPPEPAARGAGWTSGLTNRELCDGWCASYLALHTATSAEQKIRIVLTRRDYLDEIEARNRPAFDRWLASEPRGSNSPARLLAEPPAASPDDEP